MDQAMQLRQLGQCLAGVFQNREQALAEPAWFVHIKLWSRPVPLFADDSLTFFIEQASAAFPQPPYRQRVLRVRCINDDLTAEYYALNDPQAFQGAAQDSALIKTLSSECLQSLSGSRLKVTMQPQASATRFEARHYAGEKCSFTVNGEEKLVALAFDAIVPVSNGQDSAAFWMYDKGIDPETGQSTWGATNGPFKLIKIEDLSTLLPPSY
ncbi:chromophore lyase CpcT/CpeT [Oscillatoria sp. CS-180]|uniref:chromophore lyase CpcT/CpeT n=1 Tax=Oscillatoria sp. CS-180 TaxID=3021720 RepID=UPI00232C072D|nr:chromophore lyase CpcT/CpeT [Oscillatoria sp. CS-180]MDB9525316.1 chromophore lyase CpcT/CpeT [Oscillatoria sp. CS-180]